MFKFFNKEKKITINENELNDSLKTERIDSWSVKWYSRYGQYSGDTSEESVVFILEDAAEIFANKLKDAYKLLKHKSGINVWVTKNK